MPAYVKVSAAWRSVTNLYVKVGTTGGPFSNGWRRVTDGYVKVGTTGGPFSNGWRRIFSSVLTPSIAFPVEISRNNATYPSTLTGTNYNWTNSTSLTYVFQKSSDNVNFTDIGSATSINNPSSGSSNTVTYALTLSDFPAFTSYFRFVVTAVNSTYSTSATSTSTSVSVNRPAPINTVAPTISPSSGTVGVTQYSVTSNGTWDPVDADGVYQYLWQAFDTPTYVSAPGTNTLSTYTPPSNFLTLGYSSPIRCRVTAVNASGSTDAFSNTATVSAVTPTASNLATSDTTITPGSPSSITVANTATTNQGQVTWANGSNATSAWVSSVTPGSSFTGTDGGSLLTSQLFTITSSATAVATVNNKNNNKRVTVSWNQSNAASYRVNYTITNAGLANGTFNQDGNSTASSASFTVTLGNVSGTVRANSVTVYSSSGQSGVSSTFTPGSAPQTSPTDKTSSNTGSGSVTFTPPVPVNTVAPTIAPTSGTAGSTTYSVTSVGSWTNSPTGYAYQWQYNDQGATFLNISGAINSSYSPPSNFFSGLFYNSPIRCRIIASNAGGDSSPAFSNTASVSAPVVIPSGGTVSISTNTGNFTVGSVITYSTTGWSGSPTSYSLRLYNGTNPVLTSDPLRASTTSSSGTYTITSADVPNFFKAFATATNSAGTSTEVSSTQVGPAVALAPVNTVAPSVTPTSGTAGVTTYSCTTGTWNNSPTSYSYQWQYNDQGATFLNISGATSSTYLPPSNFAALGLLSPIRCRVTAANSGGSATASSNNATVSVPTVPGIVTSFTATSSLSSTTLSWNATWSAPSSNGGATITSYKVYVERGSSSTGPWTAATTSISTTSGGTFSGAFTAASPYTTVDANTPKTIYGRVTSTTSTWIRVYVAAVNSVGTGSYTTAVG
jgi:hypothetical protein